MKIADFSTKATIRNINVICQRIEVVLVLAQHRERVRLVNRRATHTASMALWYLMP
jgi:hypothetical protein